MIPKTTALLLSILVPQAFPLFNLNREDCGLEGGKKTRIIGGMETKPHQYPWMVFFQVQGDPGRCSGSLITDRLVLTSKRCSAPWSNQLVGAHNINEPSDIEPVQFSDRLHVNQDMRIIALKKPVNLEDPRIGTVCLPESDEKKYVGEKVKAMGWGMMKNKELPEVLGSVDLHVSSIDFDNITDDPTAREILRKIIFTKVGSTKEHPFQDFCEGDDGGPLLHRDQIGKGLGRRWTIIGVGTSTANDYFTKTTGYSCKKEDWGVKEGTDTVWDRVSTSLEWIKHVMEKYQCDVFKPGTVDLVGGVTIPTICGESHPEYIPHPTDCQKFYHCAVGDEPVLKNCPSGTRWDKLALRCEWKEDVPCPDTRPLPGAGCNGNSHGISCCEAGFTCGDNDYNKPKQVFINSFDYTENCYKSCKILHPDSIGITENLLEEYKSGEGLGHNFCWCQLEGAHLDPTNTDYRTCLFTVL